VAIIDAIYGYCTYAGHKHKDMPTRCMKREMGTVLGDSMIILIRVTESVAAIRIPGTHHVGDIHHPNV